jgi:hypothetical protein
LKKRVSQLNSLSKKTITARKKLNAIDCNKVKFCTLLEKIIKMRKILLLLSVTIINILGFAQKNVFLTIDPKVNGADLQIATNYLNLNGVAFELDHFDYYISGIHVIHDGGQDLDLGNTIFLVEPQNHVLYLGYLNVTQIEAINFSVGVPPNLNTNSGVDAVDISSYPSGSPLSFQEPSMYWGWTAGYMHMIIGGYGDSNFDGTPDNLFELHNLGDANYRSVQLNVTPTVTSQDQLDIYLNCNVDQWIKDIPIETVGILHGSSGLNMEIMKNIETESVFNQSATAGVNEVVNEAGLLSHYRNQEFSKIIWSEMIGAKSFQLINIEGRVLENGILESINGELILQEIPQGLYYFCVFDTNGNLMNRLQFSH